MESINIVLAICGKKNKMRVYYLSKLLNKILRTDSRAAKKEHTSDYSSISSNNIDLEGSTTFKLINFQRIRFLVIALKDGIEMFAWAPKPYHKFMPYKAFHNLNLRPMIVHMTVEEGSRIKVKIKIFRFLTKFCLAKVVIFEIFF